MRNSIQVRIMVLCTGLALAMSGCDSSSSGEAGALEAGSSEASASASAESEAGAGEAGASGDDTSGSAGSEAGTSAAGTSAEGGPEAGAREDGGSEAGPSEAGAGGDGGNGGTVQQGVTAYEGWENGFDKTKWKKKIQTTCGGSGTIDIIDDAQFRAETGKRVRAGSHVIKQKCISCWRSELATLGWADFEWGVEYWIGWSQFVAKPIDGFGILNQMHSVPNDHNWKCVAGANAFTLKNHGASKASVWLSSNDSRVNECPKYGSATHMAQPYPVSTHTGKWVDYVVNFKISNTRSGFFKVWIDGKVAVDVSNSVTVYNLDTCCKKKVTHNRWHMGLYMGGGDGSKECGTSTTGTDVIYHDEIRVGDASSNYASVAPRR